MSSVTLYASPRSTPCRFVELLLTCLKINYDYKPIYVLKGDNSTPEFKKLNPTKKIPVIIDVDGTVMTESIAICIYLSQKYDTTGKFYSNDMKTMALLNQRMLFNEDGFYRSF